MTLPSVRVTSKSGARWPISRPISGVVDSDGPLDGLGLAVADASRVGVGIGGIVGGAGVGKRWLLAQRAGKQEDHQEAPDNQRGEHPDDDRVSASRADSTTARR